MRTWHWLAGVGWFLDRHEYVFFKNDYSRNSHCSDSVWDSNIQPAYRMWPEISEGAADCPIYNKDQYCWCSSADGRRRFLSASSELVLQCVFTVCFFCWLTLLLHSVLPTKRVYKFYAKIIPHLSSKQSVTLNFLILMTDTCFQVDKRYVPSLRQWSNNCYIKTILDDIRKHMMSSKENAKLPQPPEGSNF